MLTATMECLEPLRLGSPTATADCTAAGQRIGSVAQAAAAADTSQQGPRTVDDELAEMDSAIEEAASQIEVRCGCGR